MPWKCNIRRSFRVLRLLRAAVSECDSLEVSPPFCLASWMRLARSSSSSDGKLDMASWFCLSRLSQTSMTTKSWGRSISITSASSLMPLFPEIGIRNTFRPLSSSLRCLPELSRDDLDGRCIVRLVCLPCLEDGGKAIPICWRTFLSHVLHSRHTPHAELDESLRLLWPS